MDSIIVITCPHCQGFVEVMKDQVNCAIFRHGTFKKDLQQVDPHAPKHICDELVRLGLIYGCGKPFKLHQNPFTTEWYAEKCDYI
jgi:hypothetical protein